jgi:capsular polysaccharide biosynthesis protein
MSAPVALETLIAPAHMVETGNAAGVRRIDVIVPPGSYVRPAPRAVDTAAADPDVAAWLGRFYAERERSFGPVRRVVLTDAVVAGQGTVVLRDGRLLRDSATEFFADGRLPDGFEGEAGASRPSMPVSREIAMPALLLKRPWWRNFGHWLVDSATTLALVSRMAMPEDWCIVVGRQPREEMRRAVADTLATLAPGVPVLEHGDAEAWRFARLHYPSPVHIPPVFKHPEGIASLRALMLRAHLAAPAGTRKLFVTRGAHPMRRLANEADLIAIAEAQGYETVRPETLDLAGQARLFRSAACVVGVKGAALTNLMFCPAGASALLLSPGDFADPFFWDVAGQAGVAYAELFGALTERTRAIGHNAFVIDPARFAALLPR